jgi:predicted nucleic acid-binding protein
MILSDTNILSTFAKIDQLSLLLRLFASDQIGVVPAVYEELQEGVSKGYVLLQAVVELVQQGHIALLVPSAQEVFEKDALPSSFDAGERETMAVARSRGFRILTNETHVKNWCKRTGIGYWDLPGVLRALWRTNLLTKEQVQGLIEQIEAKDRIVFKNREQIFQE